MKEEKKENKFAPLPPNFDYLDYDTKIKASEAVYCKQLHMAYQYHLGDPELISGDPKKKIWIKEDK